VIELYIIVFTSLFGAIVFAAGMLTGIRLYKHPQSPFIDVDLTPIENTQGKEHHNEEGFK